MKFLLETNIIENVAADFLVLFSTDAKATVSKFPSMKDEVASIQKKQGDMVLFHTHGRLNVAKVLVVGIDEKKCSMSDWLTVCADIGKKVKEVKARTVSIQLPIVSGLSTEMTAKGLVEGMDLGTYEFARYKNRKVSEKNIAIETVSITVTPTNKHDAATGIERGKLSSAATLFARDLVNEPSSITTPTFLATVARSLGENSTSVSCTILEPKDMKRLGMGALLGISKGSDEEPRFIKLHYKKDLNKKTVVLVGKGLTFDSGGLSLKTGEGMETMKIDMAGAATILGIFSVIEKIQPNVNVVGLIAACENMPSGKAIKPGDIVTALNGKTIEIVNTDAEGRVILADALSYAVKYEKPDAIIDLATLTGACMVALGEEIAGLFSNNESLTEQLKESAKDTGERIWPLPLAKEYQELIKGHVADIKNSAGKKYGGAITAALFLQEFVPDTVPWAHIDIAGPAFEEKGKPLMPYGGTGFGVRMILHMIQRYA